MEMCFVIQPHFFHRRITAVGVGIMITLTLVGLAYIYTEVETQDELRDVVSCVCFLGCFTTTVFIYDWRICVFSVIST